MRHKHPFPGTVQDMADRLGVTRPHLSNVLNHLARPSLELAFAIETDTKGKVKAKSLLLKTGLSV